MINNSFAHGIQFSATFRVFRHTNQQLRQVLCPQCVFYTVYIYITIPYESVCQFYSGLHGVPGVQSVSRESTVGVRFSAGSPCLFLNDVRTFRIRNRSLTRMTFYKCIIGLI